MNEDRLNYIGDKPEFKYYDNGKDEDTLEDYNLIPTHN